MSSQQHPSPGADRPRGRLRSTRQGQAVDEVLQAADGFRTAQQLHAQLVAGDGRVGLTTVYRHLNLLADNGVIDVVHRPDGEAQFRWCGPAADHDGHDHADHGSHHHHLVCRICGTSVEVAGDEVEAWADRVAAAAGFRAVDHTVEIFGICPRHPAAD